MSQKTKRGFTIVELLVALGIASILLTLVYQIFIAQRRGYSIQEQTAEAQQNARIGADELARLIRNIGNGVDRDAGQPQLLYCGPYELIFNSDLDGASPADAGTTLDSIFDPAAGTLETITTAFGLGAETYHLALNAAGGRHYELVRRLYDGGAPPDDATIAVDLYRFDASVSPPAETPLFTYYGDFNNTGKEWLTEVNDTTSSRVAGGAALDDVVEVVRVQLIAETRNPDNTILATNAGYRQSVIRTDVTPRNLWSCPTIFPDPEVYTHTLTTAEATTPPGTSTYDFKVYFKGSPEPGRTVYFSLTNPVGDPATAISDPPTLQGVTDAAGNIPVTIDWADCSVFELELSKGGTLSYTLTARIGDSPTLTGPLGTCAPDSASVVITIVPGGPDHIALVHDDADLGNDTIPTCGGAFRAIFQVQDVCDVPVDLLPGDQIDFSAWNTAGGTPVVVVPQVSPTLAQRPLDLGVTLGGAVPKTFDYAKLVTFQTPSPGGWPAGYAWNADHKFDMLIQAQGSGSFTGATAAASNPFVAEPRPATIEALTNNMAAAAQTDCPTPPVDDTFEVWDCHGNGVWDMSNVTGDYSVDVEMNYRGGPASAGPAGSLPEGRVYPMEFGVPPAPLPSGYADYPLSMKHPLSPGVTPLYEVEYQPTACEIPPGRSIAPSYTLKLMNAGTQLDDATNAGTAAACANCALTADPPTMSQCKDSTRITVSNCSRNGEWVRLRVTGSGGRNGSFDPTNPAVDTIEVQLQPGATPDESVADAMLYLGTAQDGDTLTVSAESVATDPSNPSMPLWVCGNVVAIPVTSECQNLEIYSDAGFSRKVGNTPGDENCLSRMSEIYFEVEDCQYAGLSGRLDKAVKVYLVADDGSFDVEEVDLEAVPPAVPGDPPSIFRSVRGLWIEEGPAIHNDGYLTYPGGKTIQLLAGYRDPNDPINDDWTANLAAPALPPLPLKGHDCEKLVRLQPPLPICFPNAITSGGGGVWKGNFKIHWGDVVIRGNVQLAPTPKFIKQLELGQFDGAPYGPDLTDRFVDIYVGRTAGDDPNTGNFLQNSGAAIPQSDLTLPIDRPFLPGRDGAGYLKAGESFGNYFRNLPNAKINSMMRELDYDVMKKLAKARGVYWYTLDAGNIYGKKAGTLRNAATGLMADIDSVLGLPVPNGTNLYFDGQYIFIDTFATADPGPSTTGAEIDGTPTADLPTFDIGAPYTQGVIYIAGSVNFLGGGGGKTITAPTPPIKDDVTYYPLIEDPAWVPTEADFPIRPDPSFPSDTYTLSGINLNGGIYMDGEAIFGGSPNIYGAITTERGFGGSGTPEIWYNYVLNSTSDNLTLCIACCTLELSPASANVFPGDVFALSALNKTGTMIWRSEDPAIATVSSTGVVTAHALGHARIIGVDENNCVARSEIEVIDPCSIFGIIAPSPATIEVGDFTTLSVRAKPGAMIRWSSSDTGIATIDTTTGFLVGVAGGPVIITAEDTTNGCHDDLLFYVTCPSQSLTPSPLTVTTGETSALTFTGGKGSVKWTSSDTAVASVDSTGNVTGNSPGAATITVVSPPGSGCQETAHVDVVCPALSVSPAAPTLTLGNTVGLTLDGSVGSASWSSSDPAVATVDAAGVVTAVGVGTATIRGDSPSGSTCSATTTVTVQCPSLSIAPDGPTLNPGDTVALSLSGATGSTTWTSSDAAVASVDPSSGVVTAGGLGAATITATSPTGSACSDTTAVTVQCPALAVTQAPAGTPLLVGRTYTLTVSGGAGGYTWAIDPSSSGAGTLAGTAGTDTATFVPTAPGTVTINVADTNGCATVWTATIDCPSPSVAITWPTGGSYGAVGIGSWGVQLPWIAEPNDNIGAAPLDQIQKVVFSISPNPPGYASRTEFTAEYCGFGTDDCFANPGNVSAWPDGIYRLSATAYSTCGGKTATDTVTITVDN